MHHPSFHVEDKSPELILRAYLADPTAEVSPRTRKIADRLYATQKSYPHVGVVEREEEDLESEIYHILFTCVVCLYWCKEDERHPDYPETCADCVEADSEDG